MDIFSLKGREFKRKVRYAEKGGETMPDILHSVGINATPKKVFEALSTIDGISHWWIVEVLRGTPREKATGSGRNIQQTLSSSI